jgi:hypothetical protein
MNINSQIIRNVRNELYDLGKNTAQVNLIIEHNFAELSKLDEASEPDYKAIAIGLAKKDKNS